MASLPLLPTLLPNQSPPKPKNPPNPTPSHFNPPQDHPNGTPQSLQSHYLHQVSALCKDSKIQPAVNLITELELRNHPVGPEFYSELLQGCVYGRALSTGKQIHANMVKKGELFSKNEYIETKLVIFYAKCDALDVVKGLFERLSCRNVFSWAAVIGLKCRIGDFETGLLGFVEMIQEGFLPDNFVIPNALKACGGLGMVGVGRGVHGLVMKLGFGECVFVASSLVDMYGKCGVLGDARKVFDEMRERNVVMWNSMIVGYVQNGMNDQAIRLFVDMRVEGVEPTRVTIASFLSASTNLEAVEEGKQGHAVAVLCGLELDNILGSSVLNFYAKAGGLIEDAEMVFGKIVGKDVVTWNLLVACYVQCGAVKKALDTCRMMRLEGLRFDSVTLASILAASADTFNLRLGLEAHCYCIRNNLDSDVAVACSIVDTYGKCGIIEYARRVFGSISSKDIVLWNTMLAGYAELGLSGEAIILFYHMQLEGIPPNTRSWNSVILGYMKNGLVSEAKDMFSQMQSSGVEPSQVTWTIMISGLAQNGLGYEAISHFQKMQVSGIRANIASITSVLSACIEVASLLYGRAVHGHTVRNGLSQFSQVAASFVDMYAKSGCLSQAERVFDMIEEPKHLLYTAMISCYVLHGEVAKALQLLKYLYEKDVEVDGSALTSVLSACCEAGLVNEGLELFVDMITKGKLQPSLEHYSCAVSLLSRSSEVDEAFRFMTKLSVEPDAQILEYLLAASRQLGNIDLSELLSQALIKLEPQKTSEII